MTLAFVASQGFGSNKNATTFGVSVGDQYAADELVVICLAADNSGSGTAFPLSGMLDENGTTWTQVGSWVASAHAAAAGAAVAIYYGIPTVTDATVTISANWSGSVPQAKVIGGLRFSRDTSKTIQASVGGSQVGDSGGSLDITSIARPSGSLAVAAVAYETNAGAINDTEWAGNSDAGTSGGGAASNMRLSREYDLGSETSYSFTPIPGDFAALVAVFEEVGAPISPPPPPPPLRRLLPLLVRG